MRTKDIGVKPINMVSLDFNHAITYVRDTEGNEYWLDASGSSCPLGEVYEAIEGTNALVIFSDGKSKFYKIPLSNYSDNKLHREVEYTIQSDGSISGKAKLRFTGNMNIRIRSSLKDGSENDFFRIIEQYINSNTPDINIKNLVYDDPIEIKDVFNINFDFTKVKLGSTTSNLTIFKPNIFQLDPELDRFLDKDRIHPIVFNSTSQVVDDVIVHFDKNKYGIETTGDSFIPKKPFARFKMSSFSDVPGQIKIKRDFAIIKTKISSTSYASFREVLKKIASANEENVILKKL